MSEWSESYTGLPSLGVLHWEDELPERFTLKVNGAYFWERQRTVGNKDSPLNGCTQNLTYSKMQGRSNKLKGLDSLADLGEPFGEAGSNWDSPRDKYIGSSNFGEVILP